MGIVGPYRQAVATLAVFTLHFGIAACGSFFPSTCVDRHTGPRRRVALRASPSRSRFIPTATFPFLGAGMESNPHDLQRTLDEMQQGLHDQAERLQAVCDVGH